MLHTDERFAKAVEEAVGRLEKRTDAEVIVVAAERSGSYRDVAMLAASVVSLGVLALMLYIPWHIPEILVLLDLLVVWPILVWWFGSARVLRRLVPERRRREQVREAAEAEFVREAVHGTPNRTGILVYVSALEGRVEVIPDLGIPARIAPGDFAGVVEQFRHDDLDHFVKGLDGLAALLEKGVPHTAASDDVDLPNAPRVRA